VALGRPAVASGPRLTDNSRVTSTELRQAYLGYFRRHGHAVLPSSSLVPDDPTLLFTSAGMVQFKDLFWGKVAPAHPRVTTCQKCFRTTDIERVGTTAYHHTFFEMLGNFSFGDYFKLEAIELAWRFLTQELSLPQEKLWVSVYEEDDEAYAIWRERIGIPPERIVRLGKDHNWWGPVGDRGPCGPDSEIFWDWGLPFCDKSCGPACDCGKFSEIWNLVFMQYDAHPDGTLSELAKKNIDTGMGLERMSAVLQGVTSNFDTDLFTPVVKEIERLCGVRLPLDQMPIHRNVIADHMRGVTFLIADGVLAGNEKQGYVVRRLVRRIIGHSDHLRIRPGASSRLVDAVIETLGNVYPEIAERKRLVGEVLKAEERLYRNTLEVGRARLLDLAAKYSHKIPGSELFELYDTHGVSFDIFEEVAAEHGLLLDREGFEKQMAQQRDRSRQDFKTRTTRHVTMESTARVVPDTEFLGYKEIEADADLELVLDDSAELCETADVGHWRFAFDRTPFYAEAGGQIADTGWIENLSRPGRAEVLDVQRSPQGVLHKVRVAEGEFHQGDRCRLVVDEVRRRAIERAHTATHLFHAALRRALGEHVIQAGSSVGPEEFRFDFTHFAALSPTELGQVEELAFAPVLQDLAVGVEELTIEEAKKKGAIAHFEEEYRGKERVRVVGVPGVSRELCGGTHVGRTGEIGLIVILAEEAVAAGTRRLRVVVGETARRYLATLREERRQISALAGVPETEIVPGLGRTLDEVQALRRRVATLEAELAAARSQDLLSHARDVNGTKLLSTILDGGGEEAKRLGDALAARLGRCVIVVGARHEGHGLIVAKVVDEPRVGAGDLVRVAAAALGGKGGGRSTFAQGGGPNLEALPHAVAIALARAEDLLRGA